MKYSFTNPSLLYLLVLIIPFLLYRYQYNKYTSLKYSPLQFTKSKRSNFRFYLLLVIETIMLAVAIIGAADPYKTEERSLIQDKGVDVALVLDVSASMQADDFDPTRMESMKDVSIEFVKRSSGHRIGVFIFAQEAFTQTPMTFDHKILIELIESINYGIIDHALGGGTAIGDALLSASESLIKNRVEGRDQAIILITDGENTFGTEPELAAKYLASNGIRLYIIGMAGEEPVPVTIDGYPFITTSGKQLITSLDDTSLKEIAKSGQGKYYRALDENGLNSIFHEISFLSNKPIEVEKMYNKITYSNKISLILLIIFIIWILFFGLMVRSPMR
ncbi:MAG: VWA domain-containing protein [Leptospiraceae bacterium]|nr:VWA domain-containing protein [Leptospiraceae bacterium]